MTIAEKLLPYYKNATPPLQAKHTWLKADSEGVTPLHMAAKNSNSQLLPWLLNNAEVSNDITELVNLPDNNLNTPLHDACRFDKHSHIITLLNHNATVDSLNNENQSFITYCHKNSAIFESNLLNISIKRDILERHRHHVILNPDDEMLRKKHYEMASKISPEDNARERLLLEDDVELDMAEASSSYVMMNKSLWISIEQLNSIKLTQAIASDKTRLATFSNRISDYTNSLKPCYNRFLGYDFLFGTIRRKLECWLVSLMVTGVFSFFALFIGLIIFAKVILLYHSAMPVILAAFASSPVGIVLMALAAIAILISLVGTGIYAYKLIQQSREMNQLLDETKNLVSELKSKDKIDTLSLAIDDNIVGDLEANISLLENEDISDTTKITLFKNIETQVSKISKEMVIKQKPLTPIPESAWLKPLPAKTLAVTTASSALTTSTASDASDRIMPYPLNTREFPRVGNSRRLFDRNNDSDGEDEALPLLDIKLG